MSFLSITLVLFTNKTIRSNTVITITYVGNSTQIDASDLINDYMYVTSQDSNTVYIITTFEWSMLRATNNK